MNIQDRFLETGFLFELGLAAKGYNCFVKNNDEFIDNIYGFKLEVRANSPVEAKIDSIAEGLVLTLKGYKVNENGEPLEAEDVDVLHFSRAFLVDPKGRVGTSLLLGVIKQI